MKRLYTLLIFLSFCIGINAQTVSSSCDAPDSLRAFYEFDASKLALRNLYATGHPDTSQIIIADVHKKEILDALVALYQAYELPARDEVVDFFNVHALGDPLTNSFVLYADTSFAWVKNWADGFLISGNPTCDLWIDSLDLRFTFDPVFEYVEELGETSLAIHFESDMPLNIAPLLREFDAVNGIVFSKNDEFILDIEKDIVYTDDPNLDYLEFVFRYAWDNCDDICLNEHVWTFRVNKVACSVTFIGDSGDPLPVEEVDQISRLTLSPNPTTDRISLKLVGPQNKDITIYLFDAFGQLLNSEKIDFHNGLINVNFSLAALPVGVYIITLENENQVFSERIVKK